MYFYDPPDTAAKKGGAKDMFVLTRSLDAHVPGRTITDVGVDAMDTMEGRVGAGSSAG